MTATTPSIATLGAGCFWCLDAALKATQGVLTTEVGYAGPQGPAPKYWDIHRGMRRGYVEAVRIVFDEQAISYERLLLMMFIIHDPATPNRDGANVGPEYHSTIFWHSELQRMAAVRVMEHWMETVGPVTTSLRQAEAFYPAEREHQDFFASNPNHPYCRLVILPKLEKLEALSQETSTRSIWTPEP